MTHKVSEMTLKTSRDYREFSSELNEAMKSISELEYGIYNFDPKDKSILIMMENLSWFSEVTNKAVRVIGAFDSSYRFEVYATDQKQRRLDEAMEIVDELFGK